MRLLILFSVLFTITSAAFSQQQIQGSNCDTWTENHFNSSYPSLYYWEMQPSNLWASSNAATTIVNSFCLQRTADSHSGYAAYLETKSIFSQPASGNLFTGYFISNMLNSKAMRGIPFTERPSFFKGYYKYTSVNYIYNSVSIADSCAIYTILSKWNGSQRVVVADATFFSATNVSVYTLFNLPFVYYSSDIPDTISMVFASSKNGEFYRGGIGSKLYVDDISLEYPTEIEKNSFKVDSWFAQDQLYFNFNETFNGQLSICDISGKQIKIVDINDHVFRMEASDLKPGVYLYELTGKNQNHFTGKFIKE